MSETPAERHIHRYFDGQIHDTYPLKQLILGGEDADLISGSFPGLPAGNGRAADLAADAPAPLLSRKPSGEASAAFFAGAAGGQQAAAAAPASLRGTAAISPAAVGSESLARLRCSFCWRCCCLSSMGLRRRLGLLPLPTPGGAAAFCACWPFLLLSFDRRAAAKRGPAPFSVALPSGAGCCCCCCTACSASSSLHAIPRSTRDFVFLLGPRRVAGCYASQSPHAFASINRAL